VPQALNLQNRSISKKFSRKKEEPKVIFGKRGEIIGGEEVRG